MMTRRWPFSGVSLVLFVLTGCAAQPAPTPPALVGAAAGAPPSAASTEAPAPLPPAVDENRTFLTVEGVAWYRIGPGDVIDVLLTTEVAQEPLSVEVRANGKVRLGFFDAAVAGLTTEQAAEEIHRTLAPVHKELSVEVAVKEYRSKTATVMGEVNRDGRFPLKGKTTLLDVLAEAGGPTANADLRGVRLLREGRSYTIDFLRLLTEDGRLHALLLDAGDVVFVPRATDEGRKIFLLGAVERPGAYPFTPNLRLSHALALAGGPKDTAVLESARVIRGDLRTPQLVEVDFERALKGEDLGQDVPLESNDLIVVPRSAIGNWNAFLAKLKPTLEFMSLPLQPFTQYLLIRELLKD